MLGGSGFGWLYAAEAAFAIGSKINEYNEASTQAYYQRIEANSQAAFNNRLSYNALLNTNEEEQLVHKKQALDKFELQKEIQRALAIQLARDGSANKSGGSAENILMNIERQGLNALHRKDFNLQIALRNLRLKRENIAQETASKNNKIFASLQGTPSSTGLGLAIAGTALQTGVRYKEGMAFVGALKSSRDPLPSLNEATTAPNKVGGATLHKDKFGSYSVTGGVNWMEE